MRKRRTCKAYNCRKSFVPRDRRKVYCCKPCKNRHASREWKRLHPGKQTEYVKRWRLKYPIRSKRIGEESYWKYRYGITRNERKQMERNQKSKCAICWQVSRQLMLDHDHATGKIRALLCPRCNHALGHVRESIPILQACIVYLRRHRGTPKNVGS